MKKYLVLFVVVAFTVAACGGGNSRPTPTVVPAAPTEAAAVEEAPAPGSAQEAIAAVLDVVMHDIYFGENANNLQEPPEWSVPAGSEVTLNMQNAGALEHDWAIVQPGAEIPVPFLEANRDLLIFEAEIVPPGQSASVTFTAPIDPGIYTVICSVPGHYPVMQGRLVVE